MDATSSLIELKEPVKDGLFGDMGGESEGGDTGGDIRVDVGDEINEPLDRYGSKASRRGEPSYDSADP